MYQFSEFRQQFDEHFFSFLESQQDHYQSLLPHKNLQRYFQTIRAAAQGGKRVRPYVAWVCSNKKIEELSLHDWNILTAVEVIHLFALIHDDLMDKSPTRRGIPTSHTAITTTLTEQGHSGDLIFGGRMLAMLAGDIVFWSASTLIMSGVDTLGPKKIKEIHERFTLLINDVVLGQALDFDQTFRGQVSLDEIQLKTLHKTGHYTFSYPMQIGSLLANQGTKELDLLFSIGEKIGFGFQIQDDILDVTGDPEQTQKPIMNDIVNGQHTILTAYIKENGTDQEKDLLKKYWHRDLDPKSTKELQQMFMDSGTIAHAQNIAKTSYKTAVQLISESALPKETKTHLEDIIQYLTERDH